MWQTLIDFVTTNHVALGAGLAYLWHLVTQSKASATAARVKEVAVVAWHTTTGLLAIGTIDVAALEATVEAQAAAALERLGIPRSDATLALLHHELALLAAQVAAAQLPAQVAQVADGTQSVVREWEAARRRGEATGAALHDLVTTARAPDEATAAP